ncbi:MAG TPA: AtaL-like protein [Kofleriaceae bacterium]
MIRYERSVPVDANLSRSEVWYGLTLKADNALPFVPSITYCKVLERLSPTQFVREIEFKGTRMRERVTLEPERSVTFERLDGPVMGTIQNVIDEGPDGLALRFHFELTLPGATAAEEAEYQTQMASAYTGAVDATLGAIRKLHAESARAIPPLVRDFYKTVDGMDLAGFLGHFTDDGRVVFGNNPPALGKDQIGGAIGGLWGAIDGLRHRFVNVWSQGDTHVLEVTTTYFRKDGKTVTYPCVSILQARDGKVADLRIHIDISQLFA